MDVFSETNRHSFYRLNLNGLKKRGKKQDVERNQTHKNREPISVFPNRFQPIELTKVKNKRNTHSQTNKLMKWKIKKKKSNKVQQNVICWIFLYAPIFNSSPLFEHLFQCFRRWFFFLCQMPHAIDTNVRVAHIKSTVLLRIHTGSTH